MGDTERFLCAEAPQGPVWYHFLFKEHTYWIQCMHACVWQRRLLQWIQLFATTWTIVHQAPLSMGFSRQEYWSRLPCPPPGDLPDPGIKPRSPPLQMDSLTAEPPGKSLDLGLTLNIESHLEILDLITTADPISRKATSMILGVKTWTYPWGVEGRIQFTTTCVSFSLM